MAPNDHWNAWTVLEGPWIPRAIWRDPKRSTGHVEIQAAPLDSGEANEGVGEKWQGTVGGGERGKWALILRVCVECLLPQSQPGSLWAHIPQVFWSYPGGEKLGSRPTPCVCENVGGGGGNNNHNPFLNFSLEGMGRQTSGGRQGEATSFLAPFEKMQNLHALSIYILGMEEEEDLEPYRTAWISLVVCVLLLHSFGFYFLFIFARAGTGKGSAWWRCAKAGANPPSPSIPLHSLYDDFFF